MEDIVKQVAEGLAVSLGRTHTSILAVLVWFAICAPEPSHAETRQFLHSQAIQVVHRDIKSSNVLVTATVTGKISDFGIATRQKDKAMTTRSQERST